MTKVLTLVFLLLAVVVCSVRDSRAQTTSFTYQGKLTDSMAAANGAYDLRFTLCDTNGIPVEGTVPRVVDDYVITGGIFTVDLDFGAAPFLSGFVRLLQIEVRPGASTGAYTLLTPLQEIKSAPWTIKSISASTADTATNATQLGGIAASQYVTTTTGGTNFIQNTTTQQAASNFNISGDGVVGGNLGIGTTNPAGKLHINVPGSGNPISALTLDVGTFGTAGNAVNSYYFKVRDLGLGSPAFLIRGDGNVGIATNDPTERLHVIGNGLFTGNLTVNGTFNATLPAGSGNYIQNSPALQQSGFLDISGAGVFGGNGVFGGKWGLRRGS